MSGIGEEVGGEEKGKIITRYVILEKKISIDEKNKSGVVLHFCNPRAPGKVRQVYY